MLCAIAADEFVDSAEAAIVREAADAVGTAGTDPIISIRIEPKPCVIGAEEFVDSAGVPVVAISERISKVFCVVAFSSIKLSNLVFLAPGPPSTLAGLPELHC